MGKVTQLVDSPQFRAGLICGLIAVAALLALGALAKPSRRPAIAGVPIAAAGIVALRGIGPWKGALEVPDLAFFGIAVLALGGGCAQALNSRTRLNPLTVAGLCAPGGMILGVALDGVTTHWAAIAVAVGTPTLAALASDCDDFHRRRAFGPAFMVVTFAGIYATVPDTEGARALLGAALPLLVLVIPRPLMTLGASGTAALLGLAFTVAAIEGAPRPGSIVGALGCVGMLAGDPIGRRVLPELRNRDGHDPASLFRNMIVALALQTAVVTWASRVAGFDKHAPIAAAVLLVGVGASIWAAAALPKPPLPIRGARHEMPPSRRAR